MWRLLPRTPLAWSAITMPWMASELDPTLLRLRESIAKKQDVTPADREGLPVASALMERVRFFPGDDSFMSLVLAMSRVIDAATPSASATDYTTADLIDALLRDRDESVRWAVILFLVKFAQGKVPDALRVGALWFLANDPHYWVRREVAIGAGELIEAGRNWANWLEWLLGTIRTNEEAKNDPCKEEVIHFVDRSLCQVVGDVRSGG